MKLKIECYREVTHFWGKRKQDQMDIGHESRLIFNIMTININVTIPIVKTIIHIIGTIYKKIC
jgi:hypothetical protein